MQKWKKSMPKYNVENLKNIHRYHNELQQQIDDADWMGEYDDVAHLRNELKHVKEAQDNGDVWYPMF
jgi:protein-arginine kinase activator protein McsA